MQRQLELFNAEQDWQSLFLAAQQGGEVLDLGGTTGSGKATSLRYLLQELHDLEDGSYWQSVNPNQET